MPIFELQGPDGKTYEVDAPDMSAAASAFGQMGAQSDPRNSLLGKIDTAVRGAADVLTLGTADEIAAGADALLQPVLGTGQEGESFSDRYAKNVAKQRAIDEADAAKRGGYRLAGQLGGGVAGGVGLARSGLSLGANAASRGAGLMRTAGASAVEGAALGGLHGLGSGEGLEGRLSSGAVGAGVGGALGAAAPFAIAGASTVARPLVAPIMARLRPDEYARAAIGQGLQRSGQSPQEIAAALRAARADTQGVYNVADVMGNSGQRMLSTVARNPHNARQAVVEALQRRQAGQGRRIAGALAEGFDAPDTAAQRAAALTAARGQAADVGYAAAREGAQPVDVSAAVQAIDDVLQPGATGVVRTPSNIADDSIESVLRRARSLITDGRSNLSEFNAALRAKQDIDDMIGVAVRGGRNNQARLLGQARNALDTALERASPQYAAARDAFRQGSQTIEAVETGRGAAMRGRTEDTIPAFRGMSPEQQQAFRAGYADPLIEATQGAAVGANKARPLVTDATAAEFPAFAAPGRGAQLGRRIAREMRMFETANTALGGSRTADNLADAAEMSNFDPGVMTKLFQGRPIAAVTEAVTRALAAGRGQTPAVIERIARVLMETRPDVAQRMLEQATATTRQSSNQRALVNAILVNLGASGAGRIAP